jgi:hypothetical protein
VPRSKFPSIDIHGHPPPLTSAESIDRVVAEMDKLNLRVMVSADNSSGDRLTRALAAINASRTRIDSACWPASISATSDPTGARAVAQLEADIKAGAVGVGEVPKSFGLRNRKPDGSRLRIDDPELDPIWAAFARWRSVVHSHRRAAGVLPAARHAQRAVAGARALRRSPQQPAGRRDVRRADDGTEQRLPQASEDAVHRAHFGWHANDLAGGEDARRLSQRHVEVGAILYDLGRQPRAARDFFVKYQDRICSARTRSSRASIRTTGACSKPRTSTSTTTATITRSGSCTA